MRQVPTEQVVKTLIDLQVALSKVVLELSRPKATRFLEIDESNGWVDDDCDDPPDTEGEDIVYFGDDCDDPPDTVEENQGYFGDDCDDPPVPPTCEPDTLRLLCRRIYRVSRLLALICRGLRRRQDLQP